MNSHRLTRSGRTAPGFSFGRLSAALAVSFLLIAGSTVAHGREPRFERLLADQAIARLNAELAQPGDRVAVFGDSHAALLAQAGKICGSEPLDAGIGGITAPDYLALIRDRLSFPKPIKVAVLSVGTNSARRKMTPHDVSDFRQEASALIEALSPVVGALYVAGPPPLGAEAAGQYDLPALGRYTAVLAEICRAGHCTFIDPYAGIRSADPMIARPGQMSGDGVHLADYRAASRVLAKAICH